MSNTIFNQLFDEWAPHYDQTVHDHSGEYNEVFEGYDQILSEVVQNIPKDVKTVLEFGVGTGNLSNKLLQSGYQVIGVEPSEQMRNQVKEKNIPIDLRDGHFLDIPLANHEKVEAIVSTYAFHHLTLAEKSDSIELMASVLAPKGKIIFADTSYESMAAKRAIFEQVKSENKINLLHDLETEFYEFIDDLESIFTKNSFNVQFKQLNKFVWLTVAQRY